MINTKEQVHLPLIKFQCLEKIGRKYQEWDGYVSHIKNHGSHYEIHIQSRSGFFFIVGRYTDGRFISIPAYGVGSDLAGYTDYFWNHEHLSQLMNPVDAATIAQALKTLSINNYI